ncbi:hypothetical protein NE237_001329 [Protea cynaroides]|uniref:Uncharacterized protein n=1 Tax=Protea cynaroides TaxID=273540 RepID=A0A9Q0KSW5_9MAGN|nr:hypothetical protein NE237_001329 [Protea cynaroides]
MVYPASLASSQPLGEMPKGSKDRATLYDKEFAFHEALLGKSHLNSKDRASPYGKELARNWHWVSPISSLGCKSTLLCWGSLSVGFIQIMPGLLKLNLSLIVFHHDLCLRTWFHSVFPFEIEGKGTALFTLCRFRPWTYNDNFD